MEKNPTTLFVVAAALLDKHRRILVQKRPAGKPMAGLWEFPGGKVDPGETPERALVRELEEELGITVNERDLIPVCFASEPLGPRNLVLLLYICEEWKGVLQNLAAAEFIWAALDDLAALDMPPADGPLIKTLRVYLDHYQLPPQSKGDPRAF